MTDLIAKLQKRYERDAAFKPYITSIVFPAYKNLEFGAELTFDFPLTFLIGKNGTNKSSVLHALYGCPDGKSVGEYWFSTHIDSIDLIEGRRPAYFYRYKSDETKEIPEVIKTRIQKEGDPDYWEPSRPILEYGMKQMPHIPDGGNMPPGRRKTRWNAIKKQVLYLDFRSEISAFDKAFYKDNASEPRAARRGRLRKQSKPLKEAISQKLESRVHYQKERVFENYEFNDSERKLVSKILDTKYSSIVYVEHDFYLSGSFSIYVRKGDLADYSEAFAGSGEASVVRLVYALSKAERGQLVLLDEPETSLHIAAQYKLRDYILEMIDAKCLQVIISTHSPFFTADMPETAIKVLQYNDATKRITIINKAPSDESSFYLGHERAKTNKVNIFVEDKLAAAVLHHVSTKKLSASQRDKIAIIPYLGGKDELYNLAASEVLKEASNACFIFDGDAYTGQVPDPNAIPPNQNSRLETIIRGAFGTLPHLPFDSNTSDEEKARRYRAFLSFCCERFQRLPFDNPELFIVENNNKFSSRDANESPKTIIADHAIALLGTTGDTRSTEIYTIQRSLINEIDIENSSFQQIRDLLINTLRFAPQA